MRRLLNIPSHLKHPLQRRIAFLLLIAFLISASVGIVCGFVIRELNNTLHSKQQEKMAYLQLSLHQQFDNLDNTISQIIANPYLQILAKSKSPLSSHQRSLLYQFHGEFKQYVAANPLWGNTLLYLSRNGLYQEGGFSRQPKDLFTSWDYDVPYEEWLCLLNNPGTSTWHIFQTKNSSAAIEAWFPLSAAQKPDNLGVLIIRLNKSVLTSFLTGLRSSDNEQLMLLDSDGRVLCDTGSQMNPADCSRAEITDERTGWCMVSMLNTEALEAPARFCMKLSFFLCGAMLLAGAVMGVILAIHSYEPIERLYSLASVPQDCTAEPRSTRDVYDMLENNFREMIERYDSAQLKLLYQKRYVRDHLLARLLHATWSGESAYSPAIFQENSIVFPTGNVFLLRVLCTNPEETLEISQIRINHMLEEIFDPSYSAMFFIYDMNNLGILSLPKDKPFETAAEEVRGLCLRFAEKLKETEHLELVFICSSSSAPVPRLPQLYQELSKAEDYYEFSHETTGFLMAGDIISVLDNQRPGLNAECRSQLWHAVTTENYQQAISVIKSAYDREKELHGETSIEMFDTILNTVDMTVNALQQNDAENPPDYQQLQQRLLSCSTIPALYSELVSILSDIDSRTGKQENSRNRVVTIVRSYVDENYMDTNLSVSDLSDRVGMNISSLSRTFKREMGYNLLDYINKTRIEAVMRLLIETDDTLESIAEHTGYMNVNTLIRNFKRYVGVTPGKYKQSLLENREASDQISGGSQ